MLFLKIILLAVIMIICMGCGALIEKGKEGSLGGFIVAFLLSIVLLSL